MSRRKTPKQRRKTRSVKELLAFNQALKLANSQTLVDLEHTVDQRVVKYVINLRPDKDAKIPSKRRYDVGTCPALLMQPCTSQERAAQLIEASEPLCYLGDMPLYR